MGELAAIIKNMRYIRKDIEIKGEGYKFYCCFGIIYSGKQGQIKVEQNGDIFFCFENEEDKYLEADDRDLFEYHFNKCHGIDLNDVKYIAKAYDSVYRNIQYDYSEIELEEVMRPFQERAADDCQEYYGQCNFADWLAWYKELINHPEKYNAIVKKPIQEPEDGEDDEKKDDKEKNKNEENKITLEDEDKLNNAKPNKIRIKLNPNTVGPLDDPNK